MSKKIIALAALAVLSSSAMAAATDETGFYGGVVLGSTKFKDEGGSENKTSFGAQLGYNFNANFAVEVQAQRLGKWSETGFSLTANSVNVSGLGKLPVADNISLFVRAGYSRNTLEATEGNVSASVHKNKALVGVGADFKVANNISLRTEYVNFGSNTIGEGTDSVTIKVQQVNVGLNYSF
ncbi:porin family protein [Burkholderiaceae bacterium UC74_6]